MSLQTIAHYRITPRAEGGVGPTGWADVCRATAVKVLPQSLAAAVVVGIS